MMDLFKQIPLYRFLKLCNDQGLDKTILDCGAGGDEPPLSLFCEYGYTTMGIDCGPDQIQQADRFAASKGQALNIKLGDMRELPFGDESISYVYSYNSVFHMPKKDVSRSISEMKRVLKPQGLLFVNFLTTKDFRCGEGPVVGNNEYEQFDDDLPVIHSYYEEGEPEPFFADMQILYKEDRVLERMYEGNWIRQGFVDYIAKKI